VPATRIHHLNFVVHDLDEAIPHFERALGGEPFEVIDHPARGSRVARMRLGESWLVLVCPDDPESVPGRHLAAHGEGFFLLSVGVNDLEAELQRIEADDGSVIDAEPRQGLRGWRVADIGALHGALLQLTQEDCDDADGRLGDPEPLGTAD
jgi:methylmalonyl-CoA/ethylmalonyl-CoA epimerase